MKIFYIYNKCRERDTESFELKARWQLFVISKSWRAREDSSRLFVFFCIAWGFYRVFNLTQRYYISPCKTSWLCVYKLSAKILGYVILLCFFFFANICNVQIYFLFCLLGKKSFMNVVLALKIHFFLFLFTSSNRGIFLFLFLFLFLFRGRVSRLGIPHYLLLLFSIFSATVTIFMTAVIYHGSVRRFEIFFFSFLCVIIGEIACAIKICLPV